MQTVAESAQTELRPLLLLCSARAPICPLPEPAAADTRFAISAYENVRVESGSGEPESAGLLVVAAGSERAGAVVLAENSPPAAVERLSSLSSHSAVRPPPASLLTVAGCAAHSVLFSPVAARD